MRGKVEIVDCRIPEAAKVGAYLVTKKYVLADCQGHPLSGPESIEDYHCIGLIVAEPENSDNGQLDLVADKDGTRELFGILWLQNKEVGAGKSRWVINVYNAAINRVAAEILAGGLAEVFEKDIKVRLVQDDPEYEKLKS